MIEKSEFNLITETSTTLVYTASSEFAKKILGDDYCILYIHVKRYGGNIVVYKDNDINKVVDLSLEEREYILKYAEKNR